MIALKEAVFTKQDVDMIVSIPHRYYERWLKLIDELADIDAKLTSCTVKLDPERIRSEHRPVGLDDAVIKAAALRLEWEETWQNYQKATRALEDLIHATTATERAQEIAIYRWGKCQSIAVTAKHFGIGERQIARICDGVKRSIIEYWYEQAEAERGTP